MAATDPYEPDEDDVLAHSLTNINDVYLAVATGYGKGHPNHFVTLDEVPGGRSRRTPTKVSLATADPTSRTSPPHREARPGNERQAVDLLGMRWLGQARCAPTHASGAVS